jgi:hypothetical protein
MLRKLLKSGFFGFGVLVVLDLVGFGAGGVGGAGGVVNMDFFTCLSNMAANTLKLSSHLK